MDKINKAYRDKIARRKKAHPEIAHLTGDAFEKAYNEIKQKQLQERVKQMHEKVASMTPEERTEMNRKKGNAWNNASSEKKIEMSNRLKKISNNFWNSMDNEQRTKFAKYRESCISDEQKQIRNERFAKASKEYYNSLTPEEIQHQVYQLNIAHKNKYENDEEFRNKQITQLRSANELYFANMSDEDRKKFYQKNGERLSAYMKNKWDTDKQWRDEQIEFLRSHCKDYINSLSPEELKVHNDKLFKALHEFIDSKSQSELNQLMHDNKFNKRFENQFINSIISNDFYYVKEFKFTKSLYEFKLWDYGIFSKSNNELVMVVDLDGSYYHGDSCDYNGLQSKEERDEKRGEFIPDNTKICIITEKHFIEEFEEMVKILIIDYDSYINELFQTYRSIEFPYPYYTNLELINSYRQLERLDIENNKYLSLSIRNREGDRLINHFHHSIYNARRNNKPSPYEAWYNDDLLRKVIKNRILYRSTLDKNKIVQGFNISKIATKVSVFSAGRAKLLIHKYLNEFNEIFDPFSGFSGRMLGAISLGKYYIGQDISDIHIMESKNIIKFLNQCKSNFSDFINPTLTCANILASYGTYDCLFTCPPYEDKEQWLNVPVDRRTCDDWIDECLSRFKCKRYLFIVDNTNKYQDYIVDIINNKSHFGNNVEYVILINK